MTDLLTPLRDLEPTPEEVARARAAARAPRPSTASGRRSRRPLLALAAAAGAAAVVAGAALGPADGGESPSLAGALRTAAAAAAVQTAPAPFTGVRRTVLEDRRESPWVVPEESCLRRQAEAVRRARPGTRVVPRECPVERSARYVEVGRQVLWVDSRWRGVRQDRGSRVVSVSGDPELARSLREELGRKPATIRYVYGDGEFARIPLDDLPTEPGRLLAVLDAAARDGRWSEWPRGSRERRVAEGQRRYELAGLIAHLLTESNATPALRAAGFRVLGRLPGARDLGEVRDRRGRSGRGVEIRGSIEMRPGAPEPAAVRVVFSPERGQVLAWSDHRGRGERASSVEWTVLESGHARTAPALPPRRGR